MRLIEIADQDNTIWNIQHGIDFYKSYELLKKQYVQISATYDNSTSSNLVNKSILRLINMKRQIVEMNTFCKKSLKDTETDAIMNHLKLMHHGCKSMIEELNKYL